MTPGREEDRQRLVQLSVDISSTTTLTPHSSWLGEDLSTLRARPLAGLTVESVLSFSGFCTFGCLA